MAFSCFALSLLRTAQGLSLECFGFLVWVFFFCILVLVFSLGKGTVGFEGLVSKAISLFCEDTAPVWDICPRYNKTQQAYFYLRGNGETEGVHIPSD